MKPASYYFQRFAHKAATKTETDSFGQVATENVFQANYWGRLEEPSASQVKYADADQNTQYSTLRLRDFLDVKMGDTLTELRFGEVWEVRSVSRGLLDAETVCEAQRITGHE